MRETRKRIPSALKRGALVRENVFPAIALIPGLGITPSTLMNEEGVKQTVVPVFKKSATAVKRAAVQGDS